VKAMWKRYAERIDAATLRERAMIFAAAALVVVTLLQSLLIEPQLRREREISSQQAARAAERATLQAELQKLVTTRKQDPNREARKRLETLRGELAGLEAAIASEQKKFTAPDQMRTVLEDLLSRNKRLRLVDLKTLPAATLGEVRGRDVTAPKPPASAADRLIYRHGVELTLSGSYLDMLAYLTELEKLSAQMYWGRMELTVAEYPTVTLKVTAYTVSLDRAWLIV
jgi:MSHA biogenesis protein MshJ